MSTTIILVTALAFFAMGAIALAWPARIPKMFGQTTVGAMMRNEVRAVYGGFGVCVAGLLVYGLARPEIASTIYLTIAVCLFGMAAGRVVSILIDRSAKPLTLSLCLVESLVGVGLLIA